MKAKLTKGQIKGYFQVKFLFLMVFFSILTTNTFAHKVITFYYIEHGKVNTENYFSDGKKCKSCEITVYDNITGKKLLQGKTNTDGEFSFVPPKMTGLKIVLNAGMGHRAEAIVPKTELEGIFNKGAEEKKVKIEIGISEDELRKIIREEVSKELQPIYRFLKKIAMDLTKPTLSKVLAGIGYILGITGLIIYFRNRKNG
ncbi:MAG TPA: hypothetical protein ENJ03_04670 [Candidatus Desulfofervidus auxilii]|uniref:Uncharacterized protein n=1 Tax=Desulfofervidus auxilii TaxID=1621989 RepID=A0A7V1N2T9_DESA2|nr:hypothetical protein [Candidatus Desulfofervidus auxilii]